MNSQESNEKFKKIIRKNGKYFAELNNIDGCHVVTKDIDEASQIADEISNCWKKIIVSAKKNNSAQEENPLWKWRREAPIINYN